MKRRTFLWFGVGLALATAPLELPPAVAWDEPAGFRDVPWGASEERLREHIGLEVCVNTLSPVSGDRLCRGGVTVGEVPVRASFWFRAGGFTRVTLRFDPKNFTTMAIIFKKRYGHPTASREEPVKMRGGFEYTNEVLEWTGAKVVITLTKYHGKTTESDARIETVAERDEQARRLDERTSKGAKDL